MPLKLEIERNTRVFFLLCRNIFCQETNHLVLRKEKRLLCACAAHAHWNMYTRNASDVFVLISKCCNISEQSQKESDKKISCQYFILFQKHHL